MECKNCEENFEGHNHNVGSNYEELNIISLKFEKFNY